MKIDYIYSLERLNKIIYTLVIDEQTSKRRLIKALSETFVFINDFPPHLQKEWKKIEKITLSKPKCEYNNSYYNSLINRTNKTCSKVIKEIYDVKLKLEDYIETLE